MNQHNSYKTNCPVCCSVLSLHASMAMRTGENRGNAICWYCRTHLEVEIRDYHNPECTEMVVTGYTQHHTVKPDAPPHRASGELATKKVDEPIKWPSFEEANRKFYQSKKGKKEVRGNMIETLVTWAITIFFLFGLFNNHNVIITISAYIMCGSLCIASYNTVKSYISSKQLYKKYNDGRSNR